jgi:uncharacterized protein (UPF0147 family)
MNPQEYIDKLDDPDAHVVDLVASALVDPNLHTDTRMRLYHELTKLLQRKHQELHGIGSGEALPSSQTPEDGQLPKMLQAVLVDPNLPTDERMRLHNQISEMVRAARQHAAKRAGQPN